MNDKKKNILDAGNSFQTNPIFIRGITQRSGTNFLYDLINLHPDCRVPLTITEDHMLDNSGLLVKYTESTFKCYSHHPSWGIDSSHKKLFYECLGNGLISFLYSQIDGTKKERLVIKNPGVKNIEHFFRLFPHAHLLILVRDGRAVVESAVKTFGVSYEESIREWAKGAQAISSFIHYKENSNFKYRVVKYEDLLTKLDNELRRILRFLELNVKDYNFDAATNLPVRGSSTLRTKYRKVHWKPVGKTKDFNPLMRFSQWDRSRHERFNWLAGKYLAEFGYEIKTFSRNRLFWNIWNVGLDIAWWLRQLTLCLFHSGWNKLKQLKSKLKKFNIKKLLKNKRIDSK